MKKFLEQLQALVDRIDPESVGPTRGHVDALVAAGARSEADLLRILEDQGRPEALRVSAASILARLEYEAAVPALIGAFSDDDHFDVRAAAAEALATLQAKQAIDVLVSALRNDDDARIRESAAYSLGWISDPRAVDPLIQTLQDQTEEPRVRGMAAEQLHWFSDHPVFEPVVSALKSDSPEEVRYNAAYTLGQLSDPRAFPLLERVASADESAKVREMASDAIEQLHMRLSWVTEEDEGELSPG